MVIPSLFSQFVPSASSSANTFFMRCGAVGFGVEGRKAATAGGVAIGADAAGGAARAWSQRDVAGGALGSTGRLEVIGAIGFSCGIIGAGGMVTGTAAGGML